MSQADAPRLQASEVALDPLIGGHTNVQDALAAGTGVVLGNTTTDVIQPDAPTALTGDGAAHSVACIVAAPPAWMDNAGNIIEAGLYLICPGIFATAGPTTPGLFIAMSSAANNTWVAPCDGLGASGSMAIGDTVAVSAADLPYGTSCLVTMPTDVTEAVLIRVPVSRLAH